MIRELRLYRRGWLIPAVSAAVLSLSSVAWAQVTGEGTDASPGSGVTHLKAKLDMLWVIVASCLVFFMQAGFLAFEVGSVRRKNTSATAMKNIVDWVILNLVFFLVGYGVMFGASQNGIIGTTLFFGNDFGDGQTLASQWEWVRLLFQLAFASTAATIVSGAMAERTTFKAYLLFCVAIGAFIYPLFGHWIWNPNGWLAKMGYMDFAGSSAVHMVGAVCSLVGIKLVGPRLGRYAKDGSITKLEVNSASWSALGVMMLWFCWWGFNGGSTMALSGDVVPIIINTNISGATAAMIGYFHARAFQGGEHLEEKFMGSALGGLVAITAGCNVMTPTSAFIVGGLAALVHNYSYDLILRRWRLDDVVAATPVHGFCGVLGILCIPFLAKEGSLTAGNMVAQLAVQCLGAAVCIVWTGVTAFVVLKLLDASVGLRVSPIHEIRGLGIGEESQVFEHQADPELDEILQQSGAYPPAPRDTRPNMQGY